MSAFSSVETLPARPCALRGGDGAREAVHADIHLLAGSPVGAGIKGGGDNNKYNYRISLEELETSTTTSCAAILHGAAPTAPRRNVRDRTPCCNTEGADDNCLRTHCNPL